MSGTGSPPLRGKAYGPVTVMVPPGRESPNPTKQWPGVTLNELLVMAEGFLGVAPDFGVGGFGNATLSINSEDGARLARDYLDMLLDGSG